MFMPLSRAGVTLGPWPRLVQIGVAARRFARSISRISPVAFVMVRLPLSLLGFGIIGFGLIPYAHNKLANAASEATRRLSVAEDAAIAQKNAVACGSAASDAFMVEFIELLSRRVAEATMRRKARCPNPAPR